MEISINTPALLFPAISLMMLAYTNRFMTLANLVRRLHDEYQKSTGNKLVVQQIKNLKSRINMIRYMQGFAVLSFVLCIVCMYVIFINRQSQAYLIFGASLISLLISLVISLIEIWKSTIALDLELSDMELKEKNILQDFLSVNEED
jgi:hypothetical protein